MKNLKTYAESLYLEAILLVFGNFFYSRGLGIQTKRQKIDDAETLVLFGYQDASVSEFGY